MLRLLNLVLGLLSILVPLALTVVLAVRVRRPGRGFATVGLAVIAFSQLISLVLTSLLPITGLNFGVIVGVSQTLTILARSVGLLLLAFGLIRLTRGTGSSSTTSPYHPMPSAQGYPAPPQPRSGQPGWTPPYSQPPG